MESPSGHHLLQRASLYVGDLHPDVTEGDLIRKFSSRVPIASVNLRRSLTTGNSLGYGFVNFHSWFAASNAMACLNHSDLKGKPMRIMWYQRDPSKRKSGIGNLFVKNLDTSISSSCLERIFSPFGTVLSCKVVEEDGKSKGFGFVQFDSDESAVSARIWLNGSVIHGKKLYVAKFINSVQRKASSWKNPEVFTNLFVKNLDEGVTECVLMHLFSQFGQITSAVIMRDETGKSKGFGFVNFSLPENARKAAEILCGARLGSKTIYVGRAQKKAERRKLLEYEHRAKKLRSPCLYVKNLGSMDDTSLRKLFSHYGNIISAKVMRHENGQSKGFGFVCFSNPKDSENARKMLNGAFVEGGYLYVRVAEGKQDRLRKLQGLFSRPTMTSSLQSNSLLSPTSSPFHSPQYPVPFRLRPFQPGASVDGQLFSPQYNNYQGFTGYSHHWVGQVLSRSTWNNWDMVYPYRPTLYTHSAGQFGSKTKGKEHKLCCTVDETSRKGTTPKFLEEATCVLKELLKSPKTDGTKSMKACRDEKRS